MDIVLHLERFNEVYEIPIFKALYVTSWSEDVSVFTYSAKDPVRWRKRC